MKFRSTIVLLILAAAAISYYLYDRSRTREKTAAEQAEATLFDVDQTAIKSLAVKTSEEEFEFEMRGSDWYMTDPIQTRADQGVVSAIVRNLSSSKIDRRIEDEVSDLAPFGLAPETLTLTFRLLDDESDRVLRIGDVAPSGNQVYAARGEESVILMLPSSLRSASLKDLESFRDKSIFWAEPAEVVQISIRSEDGRITASKDAEGKWTLAGEPEYKGDKSKIEGIINRLRAARASDFVDAAGEGGPSLEKMGLAEPDRTVVLGLRELGGEVRLDFGEATEGEGDNVYMRRGDSESVMIVSGNILDIFQENRATLRHKRILDLERTRVERIDLAFRDGSRIALEKDKADWMLAEPIEGRADVTKVNGMLWDFTNLEFLSIAAEPFEDLTAHGLDRPFLRADFFTIDGQSLGSVVFGDSLEGTGEVFTYSPANDYLAIVSKDIFENVPMKPEEILAE